MNVMEMLGTVRGGRTTRVFGEPLEYGGVTVVPVVRIKGDASNGLQASPIGAIAIENGAARWIPVVNVNRLAIGGQLVGAIAILSTAAVIIAILASRRSNRQAPA
jgi:hypothetical protein